MRETNFSLNSSNREVAYELGKRLLTDTVPFYTSIAAGTLDIPIALSRYLRCTAEVIGERMQQRRAA